MKVILSESDIHIMVVETLNNVLRGRQLLKEDQAGKSINQAVTLVQQKLGTTREKANEIVRDGIRELVGPLKKEAGKFTLGVTRMYCNRELDSQGGPIVNGLCETLRYISGRRELYDSYDKNLNGLSAKELIDTYKDDIEAEKEQLRNEVDNADYGDNSNYNIVRIDTFEGARRYSAYTDWCVTQDEDTFKSYTNNGLDQFYFCLRNGFEDEPMVVGENAPLDSYGLSMIAVLVGGDGSLKKGVCRWNHKNGGHDNIISNEKQLSDIVGCNFFKVFKPNGKMEERLRYVQSKLASGVPPEEVFEYVGNFHEGFAVVEKEGIGYNFINTNRQILCKDWYYLVDDFHEGFAWVKKEKLGWNFIDTDGQRMCDDWYDSAGNFHEGFAAVAVLNGSLVWNLINTNGQLLCKDWYDGVGNFHEGFARVEKEGLGYNFINTNGQILCKDWYDGVGNFHEGFARVNKEGLGYNFIDTNGQILCKDWYYQVCDFQGGFALVQREKYGRTFKIDRNGREYQ